MIISPSMR